MDQNLMRQIAGEAFNLLKSLRAAGCTKVRDQRVYDQGCRCYPCQAGRIIDAYKRAIHT